MPQEQSDKAAFDAYYLQRATGELAEDLGKVRSADDFKPAESVPTLVQALQQGAVQFSAADRKRILDAVQRAQNKKSASP